MDSRNLEMLLLYSVDDWVGKRLFKSVNPRDVTPCSNPENQLEYDPPVCLIRSL